MAIVFSIWKSFPFSYLMILSRLQAIDQTLYEVAEIDGAGDWQKFKAITLPEIYFVVSAVILLRMIWNFNKFEEIFLLTEIVRVLSIYTYFMGAFTGAMELGQGAALAVIQFILLMGFISCTSKGCSNGSTDKHIQTHVVFIPDSDDRLLFDFFPLFKWSPRR